MATNLTMNDVKKGTHFDIDGECWVVTDYAHVKPGKGGAFIRLKIKSLRSGRVVEKTMKGGDAVKSADVSYRKMSYLYSDGTDFHFMDQSDYEQMGLSADFLGDAVNYLKEGMEVDVVLVNGSPIGVNMPVKVNLKVVQTEMGVKGDTVSNVTKGAEVETGVTVQVPLFINEGDVITVDTRDGSYVTRA
jgi:elongation factor P